jgi:alpha/beta superfamily hydrolase
MSDDLSLKIIGVEEREQVDGEHHLTIRTSRGPIPIIFHPAAEPDRAALCVCGAIGGLDGPMKLYPRLGAELPARGIAIARLDYREPNEFGECVLDTMAGLSFLRAMRYQHAALIGHSFGGAVVINAGTLAPMVTTVIALSSQLAGAHVVAELAPRPLLLVHGTADTILPHECSERIYDRAGEPKGLKLMAGADHRFTGFGDELYAIVSDWLESGPAIDAPVR